MKTKTITLYRLDELSPKAQENAHNEWLSGPVYGWTSENFDTVKEFADIFPVKVRDLSFGEPNSGVDFYITSHGYLNGEQVEELSGHRLAKYIWNNFRSEIYKPKQYWICQGHKNTVGTGAKHRNSKVFLYDEFACALTGYYIDNYILSPIFDFMRKPQANVNFYDLMSDCFQAWEKACTADYEQSLSFEAFKEACEANEYTFTESGEMENA